MGFAFTPTNSALKRVSVSSMFIFPVPSELVRAWDATRLQSIGCRVSFALVVVLYKLPRRFRILGSGGVAVGDLLRCCPYGR